MTGILLIFVKIPGMTQSEYSPVHSPLLHCRIDSTFKYSQHRAVVRGSGLVTAYWGPLQWALGPIGPSGWACRSVGLLL